jgi:hypothetical protein
MVFDVKCLFAIDVIAALYRGPGVPGALSASRDLEVGRKVGMC